MIRLVALNLIVATFVLPVSLVFAQTSPRSEYRVVETTDSSSDAAELEVRIVGVSLDDPDDGRTLPVRVIVTASDDSHPDGIGRGVYADGRFFAEGSFTVEAPPGDTEVRLASGPNHMPLTFEVELEAGRRTVVEARLAEWFDPRSLGWYSGDNHVHTQHDAHAAVGTDLEYMALQARANGLNWVTEAGSNTSYDLIDRLDTESFLLRYAPELRPGAFIGHINTPGIAPPLSWGEWTAAQKTLLPVYHLLDKVHGRGGIVIHTHPLTPVTQLHWMGATEILSDGVLGRTADLLDQDYPATRQLYYVLLNLGNRIGVSGYTDAALGRTRTLSPGDRRVYAKSDALDYREIVRAMRKHRTIATSGGPLFVEIEVAGESPGEMATPKRDADGRAVVPVTAKVHSLNALKSAALILNGAPVKRFEVRDQSGHVTLETEIKLDDDRARAGLADWVSLNVEAEPNHWAVTSPVWLASEEQGEPARTVAPAELLMLQVSNAERLSKLTRDFFAHVIVTVSPGRSIEHVDMVRDGETLRRFDPEEGDLLHAERVPVTEMPGPYGPGYAWHRIDGRPVHLQADWPVEQSGWYSIRLTYNDDHGRAVVESDALRFDAEYPMSRQMSIANLRSSLDDRLVLHGYGEEMPLADIPDPWEGDRWWYPRQTWWRMGTVLGGFEHELRGGSFERAAEWFRGVDE